MGKVELNTEQAIKAQMGSRGVTTLSLTSPLDWCGEPRACVDGCRKSLPHKDSILLRIGDASHQSWLERCVSRTKVSFVSPEGVKWTQYLINSQSGV